MSRGKEGNFFGSEKKGAAQHPREAKALRTRRCKNIFDMKEKVMISFTLL